MGCGCGCCRQPQAAKADKRPQLVLNTDYTIHPAKPDDLAAIEALLSAVGLPTAGVAEGLAYFKVAVQDGIVGVIGAEYGGDAVLLRSFAVTEALRNTGIAGTLLTTALAEAKERGSKAVYLITNTAAEYFAKRNFRRIERREISETLLAKSALATHCPSSSVCMTLTL